MDSTTVENSAVAIDSADNVVVALNGRSVGSELIKYSPSGELTWRVPLEGWAGAPAALAITARDEIVVAGSGTHLALFDADGTRRWLSTLPSESRETIADVAIGRNGELFVVGTVRPEGDTEGETDAWFAAASPSGELSWSRSLGTSADDALVGVVVDADGNAIAAGRSWGDFDGDGTSNDATFLLGYAPDGELRVQTSVVVEGLEHAYDLALSANGELLVLSGFYDGENQWTGYLGVYSPSGELLRGAPLQSGIFLDSYNVAAGREGSVVIVGYTAKSGQRSFVARLDEP